MTLNPDLQAAIPQIMQLLDQLNSGRQQLLQVRQFVFLLYCKTPLLLLIAKLFQLWQLKKNKLDQCLQLRMFEQDCEKVGGNYDDHDKKNERVSRDRSENQEPIWEREGCKIKKPGPEYLSVDAYTGFL